MNTLNTNEKLVSKWETTGLLNDCKNSSERIHLSEALGEMANILIHTATDNSTVEDKTKAGILIPLVARIFGEGVYPINIDRVIELVNEEFPKLENMNQITMTGLDAEMEFIQICSEKYVHEFKEK